MGLHRRRRPRGRRGVKWRTGRCGSCLRLALAGHFPWVRAHCYWLAQLLGAALAGYALLPLVGPIGRLGMTVPALSVSPLQAILIEAVLAFFLVIAVFASAAAGRNGTAPHWRSAWCSEWTS